MIVTYFEKIVPITFKLAEEFSSMRASTGECIVNADYLPQLAELFKRGPFHAPTWASVTCEADGITYRGDGKHSSTVFVAGLCPFEGKSARVIRATCHTLAEVGEFYNQFNQPESSRSSQEINQSIVAYIPELAVMPKSFIDLTVNAIDMSIRGSAYDEKECKVSKLHKARRLVTETPFVTFLYAIHNSPYRLTTISHIKTRAVMAFAHGIYHENEALAGEFLRLVRDGSNPDHMSPDRSLYEYLKSVSKVKKNKVRDVDIIARCNRDWEGFKKIKLGDIAKSSQPKYKIRGRRGRKPKAVVDQPAAA